MTELSSDDEYAAANDFDIDIDMVGVDDETTADAKRHTRL